MVDENQEVPSDVELESKDSASDVVERVLSPEELLYARVRGSFGQFRSRQREIMRLAAYVKERADEIDDAKTRAKALIEQQLSEVNVDALDELWEKVLVFVTENLNDERLSDEERNEAVLKAIEEVAESLPDGAMSSYLEAVLSASVSPPAVPMLFGSLLVSLVGELETFIGSVARALFERTPQKLEDSSRTFTWTEITTFADLDEFKGHAIERAVEAMLRGSLSEWLTYLDTKFGITQPKLASEFFAAEVVQRRHVLVHSGGLASRQYLEKLSSFNHSIELDDNLDVDFDYLSKAADVLHVIALSLKSAAGFKGCSNPDLVTSLESEIANECFFLLQERRYDAVKMIVNHVNSDRIKSESSRLIIRINGWIAKKKLGEFETCKAEVEAFDVGSRSNDMVLAKHALLEEIEKAHDLARRMLDSGELKAAHWLTWPLLEEVRKYHATTLGEQDVVQEA